MADPSVVSQLLPSAVGGIVGGGFALVGGALTGRRLARNDRYRAERDDLVRVAAEMIRTSDAMWVADIDHIRAVFTLTNAQGAHHSTETMEVFNEQAAAARRLYSTANDSLRSLVAEMRLRQPGIAAEAEALWRASLVPVRTGVGSLNPSDETRRGAETKFIAKVRARLDEMQ